MNNDCSVTNITNVVDCSAKCDEFDWCNQFVLGTKTSTNKCFLEQSCKNSIVNETDYYHRWVKSNIF